LKEAAVIDSDAMFYRHVEQRHIKRHKPAGRTYGYYKQDDIEGLAQDLQYFYTYIPGSWKQNASSTFVQATEDDMPTIVEISRAIFNTDGSAPIPAETRLAWLRKNPETFFVLRDHQDASIVGYASILPLRAETIQQFIHDQIAAEDITADDVEIFVPGHPLHLYIMAIGIDPRHPTSEKHEYGARLVQGLFAFLLDLAGRGVAIETITARSYKPDGLRLLRKMGFPQLRSPVPGKALFVVNVEQSGFPLFVRYSETLAQALQKRQPGLFGGNVPG
jgi:hypothetical protein